MQGKSINAGWYCNVHFKMTFLITTNPFVINEPLSTASGQHLRAIGGLQKGKMSGWEVGIHIIAKGTALGAGRVRLIHHIHWVPGLAQDWFSNPAFLGWYVA